MMTIYPDDQKAQLIERMLPPGEEPVPALSRESGIPKDTLYGWRRQAYRERGLTLPGAENSPARWSSEEKFAMVVEAAVLSEAERGEYCRKRGIYPEQLQAWRQACEQANAGQAGKTPGGAAAQADKRRVRELERELRRKDQALAETAALLVLRKKARAIWGEAADA